MSELRDWARVRRQGRRRFVLVDHVLFWTILYTIAWVLATLTHQQVSGPRPDDWTNWSRWPVIWSFIAFWVGTDKWRWSEREYAAWQAANPDGG